ncbi:hypothetical protein CC85DRAFT_254066 [Cutaneotrichosporon oleaginosum]|uniref:PPP4R2-domain-containing protein n=1 Tax=Cutaneotrichosporon oleaginosum TaxID=879819 RepID=A0A0J1BDV2_9TREE|nr:uncharacterized protein CC85DRAFT_254066 [Cutaneotrichosporon oleaginosum]KLT46254.1 hypothetical protein CC85DRAFT_254066 [Cutaneotrichosporon oleaginosum]TXT10259.1 hypothetical protein COLE_04193 [Cutaneotrichosporon oleaginosum]
MAPAAPRTSSPSMDHADPVLAKLAESATFDCDWPTLRHHLYLALLAAHPIFLEKGKPPTYSGAVPVSVSPTNTDGRVPITMEDDELRPSTPGGLVIPPFAPLDPNRRRPHVLVINAGEGRLNGTTGRGNPFEDEWDEEVIIGGRKLPSWYDDEEGKREVEKVAQRIEDLPYAPFTVQRLAELLLAPTRLHSTLGKFLRAVEKTINVTTAYAPPSYTYVPPPSVLSMDNIGTPSASPSPATMDVDSTVPPGSMTPMFSPIPWATGENDALGEPMMDVDDGPGDDGLMSPLMLNEGGSVFASQQGRSPTPEPEDDAETRKSPERGGRRESEGASGSSGRPVAGGSGNSGRAEAEGGGDPGNTPYLGRVDELDMGPITSNGHHGEEPATGVGEAGNMTPHGMSDQPVPLSRTTVITESQRDIAPLPRRGAVSAEGEGEPEDIATAAADTTEEARAGAKVEDVTQEGKDELKAEVEPSEA